jgi:hypothetical protein
MYPLQLEDFPSNHYNHQFDDNDIDPQQQINSMITMEETIRQQIIHYLKLVGLQKYIDRIPNKKSNSQQEGEEEEEKLVMEEAKLSGGEEQCLIIARLLFNFYYHRQQQHDHYKRGIVVSVVVLHRYLSKFVKYVLFQ